MSGESGADYQTFATQHLGLLDQYSALMRFHTEIYNGLTMYAMSLSMRRQIEEKTRTPLPPMAAIAAEAQRLATAAGIEEPVSKLRFANTFKPKSPCSGLAPEAMAKAMARGNATTPTMTPATTFRAQYWRCSTP